MSSSAPRQKTIAGIHLFRCPRRPGDLLLTKQACAGSHKMAQSAVEEAKVRLWDCIDCKVGAANLAELGTSKPPKAAKALPEQMRNLLMFVRRRGQCTVNEAAAHFARHRSPVWAHMVALEAKGRIRRVGNDDKPVAWEVAL